MTPLGFGRRQSKVLQIPAGLGSVPPVPGFKCPKSHSDSTRVGLGHGCKYRFFSMGQSCPVFGSALGDTQPPRFP